MDSNKEDELITYIPSMTVKYEIKKHGYDIELNPVELRLIKYTIDDETYVCCTTLLDKQYPVNEFPAVYRKATANPSLHSLSLDLDKKIDNCPLFGKFILGTGDSIKNCLF